MRIDSPPPPSVRLPERSAPMRLLEALRRLRQAATSLAEARRTCDAVLETVRDPLVVVDSEARVQAINPAFSETFRLPPFELIGERLTHLQGTLWRSPRLQGVLAAALEREDVVRDVELEGSCGPDEAPRLLLANARRLGEPDRPRVLLVLEDATALRDAERLEGLRRRYEREKDVVARVSHEFRTPVAAIKGFAETLRRGGLKDRRHRLQFVRTIERHADWLGRISEQLLTLYAFESGRREPQPEGIRVAEFLRGFTAGLAPVARKRKIRLKASAHPDLSVWADRDHLEQALQSLCENAVAHAKSEVEIRAWAEAGRAVINVRDDGLGIPAAVLPTMFEGDQRPADDGPGKRGTGLGLRIARCAIQANGGRIWAEDDPGGGANLRCALPLAG
ncbi:MAG: PAS domain-containing protein [Elusimicrobia bacterium]|nr:PAS domain-containing protein [Elusimicrobiota bacterium]